MPHLHTGSTSGGPFSWAALLVPHIYTRSTSGGSSFMGCTSGAPSLHGIHFWWLVLHGLHFWCPISTRDPLLVARSSGAAVAPSLHEIRFWWLVVHGLHSWCPSLLGNILYSLDLIFPCMNQDLLQFKSYSFRRSLFYLSIYFHFICDRVT